MVRLIYADALKSIFTEKSTEAVCGAELCKAIISIINDAPTVDAEPVRHGHWIEVNDPIISCKCSVCGAEYILYEDDINGYPYCAKCGAKMDEEVEE